MLWWRRLQQWSGGEGETDGRGQRLWTPGGPSAPVTTTITHSDLRLLVTLSCSIHDNIVFIPVSTDLITDKKTLQHVLNQPLTRMWKGRIVPGFTPLFCVVNKAVMCLLSPSFTARPEESRVPLKSWRWSFTLWCRSQAAEMDLHSSIKVLLRPQGEALRLCPTLRRSLRAAETPHSYQEKGLLQQRKQHRIQKESIIQVKQSWWSPNLLPATVSFWLKEWNTSGSSHFRAHAVNLWSLYMASFLSTEKPGELQTDLHGRKTQRGSSLFWFHLQFFFFNHSCDF